MIKACNITVGSQPTDAKAEDTRSTTHGWNRTECDSHVIVRTWFEAFQCSIVIYFLNQCHSKVNNHLNLGFELRP